MKKKFIKIICIIFFLAGCGRKFSESEAVNHSANNQGDIQESKNANRAINLFSAHTILQKNIQSSGQETHGGDYLKCDQREAVVLDYYQANLPTLSGAPKLVNIESWTAKQVIAFFKEKFAQTLLATEFDEYLKSVGNYSQWSLVEKLADLQDEDLPYIPGDCSIHQAAVRQNGKVYVSKVALQDLSESQFGVLVVHEVISEMLQMFAKKSKGVVVQSSSDTRAIISEFLKEKTDFVSVAEVFNKYEISSSPFCKNYPFFIERYQSCHPSGSFKDDCWGDGTAERATRLKFTSSKNSKFKIIDPPGQSSLFFYNNTFYSPERNIFYRNDQGFFELGYLEIALEDLYLAGSIKYRSLTMVVKTHETDKKYPRYITLGFDLDCQARDNTCRSKVTTPFYYTLSNKIIGGISPELGATVITMGRSLRLMFENDPDKNVLESQPLNFPQGKCENLNKMLKNEII